MSDKIVLYTNRRCPWAQRAHIALAELGLPFTEEAVDLDTPRTQEYLAINPRGLVPTLVWNDNVIIESSIVANFLADQYPSHLSPPSNADGGALYRARVALFVDAFISKVQNHLSTLLIDSRDDLEAKVVDGVVKEVEPLVAERGFFGGSEKLTLAEVLTGSFVLRLLVYSDAGLYPATLVQQLEKKAPKFIRWARAVATHPSVIGDFDGPSVVEKTKDRIETARKQKGLL